MKEEYIVKIGIPLLRTDSKEELLKKVEKIEERICLKAIKDKHMYGIPKMGRAIILDAMLLSPTIQSFGKGKDIAFYSFVATQLAQEKRIGTSELTDLIQKKARDYFDISPDMTKGLVKGIQPSRITSTDVPYDHEIIVQEEESTERLREEGFFRHFKDVDYSLGYDVGTPRWRV